jgi:hypothetical protein
LIDNDITMSDTHLSPMQRVDLILKRHKIMEILDEVEQELGLESIYDRIKYRCISETFELTKEALEIVDKILRCDGDK